MDFRKIGAARLVLCTATEAGAGIVSGSIAYLVSPTMSGQVVVDRQGDLPEVSGDVPDADAMLDALDSAVRSYVDWSVRFRYLGRRSCLLGETGEHAGAVQGVPGRPVDREGAGRLLVLVPAATRGRSRIPVGGPFRRTHGPRGGRGGDSI